MGPLFKNIHTDDKLTEKMNWVIAHFQAIGIELPVKDIAGIYYADVKSTDGWMSGACAVDGGRTLMYENRIYEIFISRTFEKHMNEELLEMVIAHELIHTIVGMGHGPHFSAVAIAYRKAYSINPAQLLCAGDQTGRCLPKFELSLICDNSECNYIRRYRKVTRYNLVIIVPRKCSYCGSSI